MIRARMPARSAATRAWSQTGDRRNKGYVAKFREMGEDVVSGRKSMAEVVTPLPRRLMTMN